MLKTPKKILCIVIGAFLLTTYGVCQSDYPYEVVKVTNDVYLLRPTISRFRWVTANIIVVVNEQDAFVVDSGLLPAAGKSAVDEIKKITNKPVRYLVNTHWHGDHWQGNEAFVAAYPGIEIISSSRGSDAIRRNGVMWVTQFYNRYLQSALTNYEKAITTGLAADGTKVPEERLKGMRDAVPQIKSDIENLKVIKPVFPTLTFRDKMILRSGNREFQLHYLGIGNTVGDAVVYLPNEKILITGDIVVHPSPYESGAFSSEWVETSKKLKNFPFAFLLPGHGEIQTDSGYLDYLNALFAEIVRQMNDAYLSGKASADEASMIVTHQSVVSELSKNPQHAEFVKNLDTGFVPAAVRNSYREIILGKF